MTGQCIENKPGDGAARPCAPGREHWAFGVERVAEDLVELVGDFEQYGVGVDADTEFEGNDPAAVIAVAGHLHQALDTLELFFLVLDDLLLDLLWARAWPGGGDGDDRAIDVGGELDGDAEKR